MSKVTFNGTVYSATTLEAMTGSQLVNLHNQLARKLGKKAVNRFATKSVAVERTDDLLQMLPKPAPEAYADPEASACVQAIHSVLKRSTKVVDHSRSNATIAKALAAEQKQVNPIEKALAAEFKKLDAPTRGTNLAAPGHKPIPCREDSKQSAMVDMLSASGGATMAQLRSRLSWTEATVRSGFGWDMKQKGYGVRSEGSGAEARYHLVLPKAHLATGIPAHTPRKTPKAGV